MQNETGNNVGSSNDITKLEAEVRSAVAQDDNVQEAVQHLTLTALSAQIHDLESLRRIMTAVMQGAREGAQQKLQQTTAQAHTARTQLTDAVAGLDAALAQLAEASKLAVEEATGRAQKFSDEELARARADLESLFARVTEQAEKIAEKAGVSTGNVYHHFKDKEAIFQRDIFEKAKLILEAGKQLRYVDWKKEEHEALKPLFLITLKPVMFVANVGDDDLDRHGGVRQHAEVALG